MNVVALAGGVGASKLLEGLGHDVSALGVARLCVDFLDGYCASRNIGVPREEDAQSGGEFERAITSRRPAAPTPLGAGIGAGVRR